MTGSFLFVKPSDPKGEPGTAYSGESPRYPYDRASWEWMLERALRRTLLPWALAKSHSRVLLHGHEGQYSMHRWGSFGDAYRAGVTPSEYEGVGGRGAVSRKTDADLSSDGRRAPLPESWDSGKGAPAYSSWTRVVYGIADLEETVALLPFSTEWLHPGWSSSALGKWDLEASTTETTQGSAPDSPNGYNWTWHTTVEHRPYAIPDDVPFKCLSHMRTDDPTVTAEIENDDNGKIEVETAPTPMSATRTAGNGGSVFDYRGTQVRGASRGAAYGAGWALSEFCIRHWHGLDYGESTSSLPYGRDGKTAESPETIGCLVDVPDKDSGNIVVSQASDDEWAGFVHEVDWGDGKQTWWHANGFPKGLGSVLSPKLRGQLQALCPKCQPAIPPAVPALRKKLPDAGRLPWDPLPYPLCKYDMFPRPWMRNLSLSCTPVDMSARLDAMTTTVHRVPTLFAKVRTVTTTHKTTRRDWSLTDADGSTSQSWTLDTERKVVTGEGTSSDPIPSGSGGAQGPSSWQASGTSNLHTTNRGPTWSTSSTDKTEYTHEGSFKSNSDFLVCLRSTSNTTLSMKFTTKTSKTSESSDGDPDSSQSETSAGSLPGSYDPDPDDLLFPDWVLPWIETAELFASVESFLVREDGAGDSMREYRHYPHDGEPTFSYSGSGSGTRTYKAHRKLVSLGRMDTSTGRFPALDAEAVLLGVDPDPTEPPNSGIAFKKYDSTDEIVVDSDGNRTETTSVDKTPNSGNGRSRSVSYYVVVRWKFDRTDPETLKT